VKVAAAAGKQEETAARPKSIKGEAVGSRNGRP
jgi:hypothetical protein